MSKRPPRKKKLEEVNEVVHVIELDNKKEKKDFVMSNIGLKVEMRYIVVIPVRQWVK